MPSRIASATPQVLRGAARGAVHRAVSRTEQSFPRAWHRVLSAVLSTGHTRVRACSRILCLALSSAAAVTLAASSSGGASSCGVHAARLQTVVDTAKPPRSPSSLSPLTARPHHHAPQTTRYQPIGCVATCPSPPFAPLPSGPCTLLPPNRCAGNPNRVLGSHGGISRLLLGQLSLDLLELVGGGVARLS